MAATLLGGRVTWGGERDDEGHRTFNITHFVKADFADGPKVVMDCAGLPVTGSTWNFGNDTDSWAFCYPYMKVAIHKENEGDKNRHWKVDQKFSTKPLKRCQDTQIENPLMEPDKLKGGFTKKTREFTRDKDGQWIRSSSWEQLRGPQVEFDDGTDTVSIEQNVSALELALFSGMKNHVNDAPLWGVAARCVKLSNASWERVLYGTCTYYYKRHFEFEVNPKTFDRNVLDEGTKCLAGHWDRATGNWVLDKVGGADPVRTNPSHFNRYRDRRGEIARVILDGRGLPANTVVVDTGTGTGTYTSGGPATRHVKAYPEANFLLLGIPVDLES